MSEPRSHTNSRINRQCHVYGSRSSRRGSNGRWQLAAVVASVSPRVRGRATFEKERAGSINNKLTHCYGEDLEAVRRHFVELTMAIEDCL